MVQSVKVVMNHVVSGIVWAMDTLDPYAKWMSFAAIDKNCGGIPKNVSLLQRHGLNKLNLLLILLNFKLYIWLILFFCIT